MSLLTMATYGLMFLGSVLLLEGLTQFLAAIRNPQEKAINRRLRLLESGHDPEEIYRLLRRRAGREGWLRFSVLTRMNDFLQQAGVTVSLLSVGLAVATAAISMTILTMLLLHLAPLPAAGLSAAGVIGALVVILSARRHQRLAKLEAQLPELLELIVRSVRSGHPLSTALRLAANEMEEPLGSEVGLAVDETTYGVPLDEAVEQLAARIGLTDYIYFAVVTKITSKTGGNLAAILEMLSSVIRDRTKMRRKILAVSAEGRMSGLVMSAAPVAIAGVIMLTSPNFFLEVMHDPLFDKLAGVVVFLIVANYLTLQRLVKFEI